MAWAAPIRARGAREFSGLVAAAGSAAGSAATRNESHSRAEREPSTSHDSGTVVRGVTQSEVNEAARMIFAPTGPTRCGPLESSSNLGGSCFLDLQNIASRVALDPAVQRAVLDQLPLTPGEDPDAGDDRSFELVGQGGQDAGQPNRFDAAAAQPGRPSSKGASQGSASQGNASQGSASQGATQGSASSSKDSRDAWSFEGDTAGVFGGAEAFGGPQAASSEAPGSEASGHQAQGVQEGADLAGLESVIRELQLELAILKEDLEDQMTLNQQLVYANEELQDKLGDALEQKALAEAGLGLTPGQAAEGNAPGGRHGGGGGHGGRDGAEHGDPAGRGAAGQGGGQGGGYGGARRRDLAWAVRGTVGLMAASEAHAQAAEAANASKDPAAAASTSGGGRQRGRAAPEAGAPWASPGGGPTGGGLERGDGRVAPLRQDQPTAGVGVGQPSRFEGDGAPPGVGGGSKEPAPAPEPFKEQLVRGAVLTLATSLVIVALMRRHKSPKTNEVAAAASAGFFGSLAGVYP